MNKELTITAIREHAEEAVISAAGRSTPAMRFGPLSLEANGITSVKVPDVADLLAAGAMINRCESGVQWWIGDWMLYAENTPGMVDVLDQAIENWSMSLKTLEQCKLVSQAFPIRNRMTGVSWTIHRTAMGLEHADDQMLLLSRAGHGMTVREARQMTAELKHARTRTGKTEPTNDFKFAIAEPDFWVPDAIVGSPGSPITGRRGQQGAGEWAAMQVEPKLDLDATVYVVTTPTTVDDAIKLAEKWGLKYRTMLSVSWEEPADTYYYHAANNQMLIVVATRGYPAMASVPVGATNHPTRAGAREWLYGHLLDVHDDARGLAVFTEPPGAFRGDYSRVGTQGVVT